ARAAGTSLPFSYCLVMHPMLSLMMALPLSIGGVGGGGGGRPFFLPPLCGRDPGPGAHGVVCGVLAGRRGGGGAVACLASAAGAALPRLRTRPASERVRGAA